MNLSLNTVSIRIKQSESTEIDLSHMSLLRAKVNLIIYLNHHRRLRRQILVDLLRRKIVTEIISLNMLNWMKIKSIELGR